MAGAPLFQFNVAALLPPTLSQAGQTFRGVVAELEGALVIRANGATIPLGDTAGLSAGQHVAVRVLHGGVNPQIQVSPLSVSVQIDPKLAPLPDGAKLTGDIVSIGGKLTFVQGKVSIQLPANQTLFAAGERAIVQIRATVNGIQANVTPASGGANPVAASLPTQPSGQIPVPAPLQGSPAAAQVQALFTQAETLGVGLAALQASVVQPSAAAILPVDIGLAFAQIFAPLLRPDADDFSAGIKRWAQRLASSPEAALAKHSGAAPPDTPAAVLQRLQNDPAFRQMLLERGELRAFDAMADRVLERLGGGHLQQLRSLEHPYWFLEFPFDPASGIERALVHFFPDDAGSNAVAESRSASVVLDLSLTQLGDVWVKVAILSGRCTCHISVVDEDILALVREHADDLVTGLASTGAQHVSVHADLWDGDRIARNSALLGAMDGMDVSA